MKKLHLILIEDFISGIDVYRVWLGCTTRFASLRNSGNERSINQKIFSIINSIVFTTYPKRQKKMSRFALFCMQLAQVIQSTEHNQWVQAFFAYVSEFSHSSHSPPTCSKPGSINILTAVASDEHRNCIRLSRIDVVKHLCEMG